MHLTKGCPYAYGTSSVRNTLSTNLASHLSASVIKAFLFALSAIFSSVYVRQYYRIAILLQIFKIQAMVILFIWKKFICINYTKVKIKHSEETFLWTHIHTKKPPKSQKCLIFFLKSNYTSFTKNF